MSNTTGTCVYPLVETIYAPYVTFGETSCGIICGKGKDFFMFYTSDEEQQLKTILIVMSLITICFVPLYFCIALSERRQRQLSFCELPFANQCPLFISSGYILVACITMSPYIFGKDNIICNEDEETVTSGSFHNIPCSITAIGIYVGIRLLVFYDTALSISLVLTLYCPSCIQLKRYFHISVFVAICLGMINVSMAKSVTGDYHIGFCTTSLSSRAHSLTLNIIPLGCCIFIFFVCLVMVTIKLFRQDMGLVNAFSVNSDMQSLFKRLILYNLFQTTAVGAVVGNFCYWYLNIDSWQERANLTIQCEMGKTLLNQTSSEDYEMCVGENGDLPRPQMWTYFFFLLCALISLLGAIIFKCSRKVQQRTWSSFRDACSSLVERLTNVQRTSDMDRLHSMEPLSTVTELNQTGGTDMTILDTLDSPVRSAYIDQLQTTDMTVLSQLESGSSIINMQQLPSTSSSNKPFLSDPSMKNLVMIKET